MSRNVRLRHPAALSAAIALAVAVMLPAIVLGVGPAGSPDTPGPVPALAPSANDPVRPALTVATIPDVPSPHLAGAVADPAGRLWVRSDAASSATITIPRGSDPTAAFHRAELSVGEGFRLPSGAAGRDAIPVAWSSGARRATVSVRAVGADEQASEPASIELWGDAYGPLANVDALRVDAGQLTFRWSDSDAAGSGIVGRTVRVETATATATGCGEFTVRRGITLTAGTYDAGTLSLGTPPSSGCLRASLVLTDRVGLTSVTATEPYRVQPPAPDPTVREAPAPKRWSGRFNLYRESAFVTQKTFRWCVAASVQMMVNLVRNHTDRTAATQRRMITYAQRWDNGPYGEDGGTDVTGWIAALRHFGAGDYRAVGTRTSQEALRIAATAMRQTGRPAGILVMEGRHAWVLHGFESRSDPKVRAGSRINAVRVSGPLYPVQQKGGYDPHPNTRLTAKALARYFQPSIVGELAGQYVVVVPTH